MRNTTVLLVAALVALVIVARIAASVVEFLAVASPTARLAAAGILGAGVIGGAVLVLVRRRRA